MEQRNICPVDQNRQLPLTALLKQAADYAEGINNRFVFIIGNMQSTKEFFSKMYNAAVKTSTFH